MERHQNRACLRSIDTMGRLLAQGHHPCRELLEMCQQFEDSGQAVEEELVVSHTPYYTRRPIHACSDMGICQNLFCVLGP